MAKELTEFQKRVLAVIESAPMQHASWTTCALYVFKDVWNTKHKSHGAFVRSVQRAAYVLEDEGYICILPPRDRWGAATYCRLSTRGVANSSDKGDNE